MSVFQSGTKRPGEERRRGGEAGLSIIAVGMTVTGDIETDGVVKIEGVVHGSIRAARQVLVAQGAVVEGNIDTREAVVGGEVRGTIRAEERAEVQTTSVVHGDIATNKLAIAEGGQVNGEIRMGQAALAAEREPMQVAN